MIVWINGAYCVGKSSSAKKIEEIIGENVVEILESDYFYLEMLNNNPYLAFGGTLPQNNLHFISYFKKIIEERLENTNKMLIVVMSLTQKECKELLFDSLKDANKNILHIILTASKEIIKFRIENDTNSKRDKNFALSWLDENLQFLNNNFNDAMRINTETKNINDIAFEIIKYIKQFNE